MKIPPYRLAIGLLASSTLLFGCKGDDGPAGPVGPPAPVEETETELHPTEDGPGINIAILSVDGASGSDGTFQVGDSVSITFTAKKDDGTDWQLSEFRRGRALLSGPTFNYQRVIPEQKDVKDVSVDNGDGTWTFTFDDPIPTTYVAPYNDTAAYGAIDGELTDQPLLAGTYTVGLYFTWRYTVDGQTYDEVDNITQDLLFLGATTLATREVVTDANCNACHDSLRAHGGQRTDVTICLMCHTAGSEDRNNPSSPYGETPGASIDMKVMIHKIHNGAHLPSVNGVATNTDGTRDYTATPEDYVLVGYHAGDFSNVHFPRWPNLDYEMPRDAGYGALAGSEQDQEDAVLGGVTDCAACHGDPDGDGPLVAPAQGSIAYEQPSRNACGSCHDDIDWSLAYSSNLATMPPQADDSECLDCHPSTGATGFPNMGNNIDAHLHPMRNPAFNPGMNFVLSAVDEAGTNDGDGTIDPGEKVAVTFTVQHDNGDDVDPANLVGLGGVAAVLSGPTSNLNLVLSTTIPSDALTGAQPYTVNLPQAQFLERLATGTGSLDIFETDFSPLWDDVGAASTLLLRGADGGLSVLSAAASPNQNYLDVANSSIFAVGDVVVVDDTLAAEEYLEIQWIEGDRLWFASAYQSGVKACTTQAHPFNAPVKIVNTTTLTVDVDYSVNAAGGSYTELIEQGNGAVILASYTSDFVMPTAYPVTFNESPDVDETWGKWTGLPIVDGTYRLGLWCDYDFTVDVLGEVSEYPNTSIAGMFEVLVGDATTLEPYGLIEEAQSCYNCHEDIYFHGGHRRGFDACIQCHGAAGGEDRPQYVAPNADPTTETMVKFREMIHKIHMGSELTNGDTYVVNGFGLPFLHPDNFTPHKYDEVVFPAFPGGAKHCTLCHGDSNAWEAPADLAHPTASTMPSQGWRVSCGSCHDADAAHAHMAAQTAPTGEESCAICHDDGSQYDTEYVHNPRK